MSILAVRPAVVAHDLHPDFFSTRHAARLAQSLRVPRLGVAHHHAHIAAVIAEHRIEEPVLGVALDGVGLGTDGGAWGGELLHVEGSGFRRLGHLTPLRLPGADIAAREPWRMAAAALARCGRGDEIARRFRDEPAAATVSAMLSRGVNSPATSSMGRQFDAAAGLLGIRRRMAFEGQAAMLLEGLAESRGAVDALPGGFAITPRGELDFAPLFAHLADECDAAIGAALFHATVVAGLAEWVARAAQAEGLRTVACGGGCFLNAILARDLRSALAAHGLVMHEALAVPPNDGGLCLGQALVAQRTPTPET
jgi:hydrogenase maturation protein HypF